ncbi:short chain dehydrogenase [Streptomyces sp. enrichment culture]|uniref:short chain dehydrogenase n=1 Tax=Streptomyces sp. enrichment culture TaxID=1795815 RepID=UPI003F5498B9
MKIMVIGATGTIGGAVVRSLRERHVVVPVSRSGPLHVDLGDAASIDALFRRVGEVDAVVSCAASGGMAALDTRDDEEFWAGLHTKLVGQITLVRRALSHVKEGGSITLTSGRFTAPVPGSSPGSMINAGLEAFVSSAVVEMPRSLRLNVVSPGWVRESLESMGMDPTGGTPVADVANVYVAAVEGSAQGEVLAVAGH